MSNNLNNVKTSLKQIAEDILYQVRLPKRSPEPVSAEGHIIGKDLWNKLITDGSYDLLTEHLESFDRHYELTPGSNKKIWKNTIRPIYLTHAIECCYKEFNKSKYEKLFKFLNKAAQLSSYEIQFSKYMSDGTKKNVRSDVILDNFLYPITDIDGLLFLRYFLRFKRLTLILCMNPDYLTHSVKIDKKDKRVIDWYRIVYERLEQLSTSHTGVNSVKTTITTEFNKITTLYKRCTPLFEALYFNLFNNNSNKENNKSFKLENLSNKSKPPGYKRNNKSIPRNFRQSSLPIGGKQYIKLQKGGKRLIRQGPRGGKYYMKGGNKVYVK